MAIKQKKIKPQDKRKQKSKTLKHDALFKKIMENPIAAQEFLEFYLPSDFKALINLNTLKIEKESFVEENLKRRLSDLVYSVQTHDNNTAFVYVLVEAQSTPDYWIAFRLWQYMLLLCERHKKDEEKLPLIAPLVFYNGTEVYKAPLNLWELFNNPQQAQNLMINNYQLVNLQAMTDDEIKHKKHLGMLEYFMKHIHYRDTIELWKRCLEEFKEAILIDKQNGYVYIKNLLWYTDSKVPEDRQLELEQILTKHLTEPEGQNIMRTIAQAYEENGIEKGIQIGEAKGKIEIAKKMLSQNYSLSDISNLTELSPEEISKL